MRTYDDSDVSSTPVITIGFVIATAFAFVKEAQSNFALAKAEAGAMAVRISEHHAARSQEPGRTLSPQFSQKHRIDFMDSTFTTGQTMGLSRSSRVGRREWKARWNWEASRWGED